MLALVCLARPGFQSAVMLFELWGLPVGMFTLTITRTALSAITSNFWHPARLGWTTSENPDAACLVKDMSS